MAQVDFEPRPCWSQAQCFNHSTMLLNLNTSFKKVYGSLVNREKIMFILKFE